MIVNRHLSPIGAGVWEHATLESPVVHRPPTSGPRMTTERLSMRSTREILRQKWVLGRSHREVAASLGVSVGVIALTIYFVRAEKYVRFHAEQWQPRLAYWKRIFVVGVPAGCEFALIFLYTSITYWAIRSFGAAAQAGFGVGSRVMQGIFVPALAVAYSAAPIAGQNFGARNFPRVRATFQSTVLLSTIVMSCLIALCQWNAEIFVHFFSSDAEVTRIGALFLRTVSWNFVAQGLIFSCSNNDAAMLRNIARRCELVRLR